jgi:hypothetical protein
MRCKDGVANVDIASHRLICQHGSTLAALVVAAINFKRIISKGVPVPDAYHGRNS